MPIGGCGLERARLLISPCRWKSWWRSPTAPTAAPHPSPSAACKSVGLCHRSPKGGPDSGLIFAGALQKGTGVSKKKEKEKKRNVKKQQMKGSLGRKTGTGRSRYFLLCARLSASQEGSLVSLFPSLILSFFFCARRGLETQTWLLLLPHLNIPMGCSFYERLE